MAVLGIVFERVIVLAKQVLAVVITVRCPDYRMDVAACRLISRSFKRDRALMIEFDENDRAVNSAGRGHTKTKPDGRYVPGWR